MTRRFADTVTLLALVGCSAAAPLAWGLEITGPDSTPVYRRAVYGAKAAADQSVAWDISPDDVAEIEQVGDGLRIWAPPGRYTLYLTAVGPSGNAGKPFKIEQVKRKITIGPADPAPPNPPVVPPVVPPVPPIEPDKPPKPDPAPVFPAGKFGLAAKSYSWASALDAAARAKSKLIASNYRGVAQQIRKANAGDPLHNVPASFIPRAEVIRLTTGGNDGQGNTWGNVAAIGSTNWVPFFKALGEELAKLDLKTDEDLITAWDEIGTGLDAVKPEAGKP